jgi:hypothetical protein
MNLLYTCVVSTDDTRALRLFLSTLFKRGKPDMQTTHIYVITTPEYCETTQNILAEFNIPREHSVAFTEEEDVPTESIRRRGGLRKNISASSSLQCSYATAGVCNGFAGFAITGETKYSRVLYIDVYSLFCREIAEIFAFHPEDNVIYKSPSESIVYFGETSDTDTEVEPIRVNTEVMRSFTTTTTLPDGRETSPCVRIFPEDDDFTLETSQIYANMLSEWKRMFSVAFITLTTTGYADYTLNCVESLRRINAEPTLQVYCIGSKGTMRIAQKDGRHSRTMQMNAPDTLSGMQTFKNENWANITFCKFPIIYSNLLSHDYVCFTDGDIVFENAAFYDYLIEHIGSNDMIVQSEWHNNDIESFCTGFMFIQSSPATIQIFDPRKVNMQNSDWDDQAYLNGESPKMKTARLPIELFPNGCFYFQNHSELNPYMIHFNWLIGNQKREKMISLGKWYGGDPVPPRPPGVL